MSNRRTGVYFQGKMTFRRTPSSRLEFCLTRVAKEDTRFGSKLRRKSVALSKGDMRFQEGQTFEVYPHRKGLKRYNLIDSNMTIIGYIIKSNRHWGWWRFIPLEPQKV